ncbi:uncharacterized protein LOC114934940 [Nylanderia fulva]|uniref:uncharacterized protein LOC114934940 n=1 Tax=Nylanderia fulva TaxID=613905 RepID=UPI0010FB4A91|nr:uncharacterized protein LOC114934940 [Nylanderia fulva]
MWDYRMGPKVKIDLFVPKVEELIKVLQEGLKQHFKEVSVEWMVCPDLTQEPFKLAAPGICGDPMLVELGCISYLFPRPYKNMYSMKKVLENINYNKHKTMSIIGTTIAPRESDAQLGELLMNASLLQMTENLMEVKNQSCMTFQDEKTKNSKIEYVNDTNLKCYPYGSFFISKGTREKVLKVHVKKRISNTSFVEALQSILDLKYSDGGQSKQLVGLGGTFLVRNTRAKHHVLPYSWDARLYSSKDVRNWLHYFELNTPLVAMGTLVSNPDIYTNLCHTTVGQYYDIPKSRFHAVSRSGAAGGYFYKAVELFDTAEYVGYFQLANILYHIDPSVKSQYYQHFADILTLLLVMLHVANYKFLMSDIFCLKKTHLFEPENEELAKVLQDGFRQHFVEATVEWVMCPDLTEEPFNLSVEGICGNPVLLEFGCISYLFPRPYKSMYDINTFLKDIYGNYELISIIGASVSQRESNAQLGELAVNASIIQLPNMPPITINQSYLAYQNKRTKKCALETIIDSNIPCYPYGSFFVCKGRRENVLKVQTKKRLSNFSFLDVLKSTLDVKYSDDQSKQLVGLGGIFMVRKARVKHHVLPYSWDARLSSTADVYNFLHYFDINAPLIAMGTLVSNNKIYTDICRDSVGEEYDIPKSRFHTFSYTKKVGGHFYRDVGSNNTVEYLGYFQPASVLYHLDPQVKNESFRNFVDMT